jgi:stage II sporulation protein D
LRRPHEYLLSRPDEDGGARDAHAPWRYENSRSAVHAALNADPRTRVGTKLVAIEIVDRDPAGRAARVRLNGTQPRLVRGTDLREVLSGAFGARSVRSTRFDVRQERERIVFEGRGFGHGVGLCQAGALARIRGGASLSDVLQRYFPGTALVKMNS